ncbi:MAG: serine hydrolase domain-containing protein [Deltaproteobacteria bacterium]
MRLQVSCFEGNVRRRALLERILLSCGAGLLLAACAPEGPHASADEIERAKQVYTACVEDELGLELERLEISSNGDIEVELAPGSSQHDLAQATAICEPRIGSVLEPGGASVLGPPPNLGRPGSDADLAALLAERARLGFEGAILVEAAGMRRIEAGYGRRALDSSSTPDTLTAFDCGSIMKDVTAATIFMLDEDGALSRDQPLSDFFPDVPSVWSGATIEQLITHSAGFGEYHDTQGDFEPMERGQALAAIFAQLPRFPPGTDSAYSNSGYTLLAALIEQVTGHDYRSVVRERVFEPVGMQRSGFYGEPLWSDGNVAVGRGADQYGGNDPARWPEPTWALLGNGGLVSDLEDLLRFARARDRGELFQLATRAAYWREQPSGSIAGKAMTGSAGGNDFGFNAVTIQVAQDETYVVAASHVLSPVSAEILAVEVLQTLYGAVLELP